MKWKHFLIQNINISIQPALFMFFILINTTICNAQISGKIIYKGYWPVGKYRIAEGKGEMIFNEQKSSLIPITKYNNFKFNEGKKEPSANQENPNIIVNQTIVHGDTSNMASLSDNDPFNIYTFLDEGKIYQTIHNDIKDGINRMSDSILILQENLGVIKWVLCNEQKQIGNYNCQKAITRFRGRDYTAWFTLEIPVSFGPWKLNSLPGLILEVIEASNEIYFLASSVEINTSEKSIKIDLPNYQIFDQKKYQWIKWEEEKVLEKKQEEIAIRLKAKAPKGTKINYTFSILKNGLEKEFEFIESIN